MTTTSSPLRLDTEALRTLAGALEAAGADPYRLFARIEDHRTRFHLGWRTLEYALTGLIGDTAPTREPLYGLDLVTIANMATAALVDDDGNGDAPCSIAATVHQAMRHRMSASQYLSVGGPRSAARVVANSLSDLHELRPALVHGAMHLAARSLSGT